MSRSKVRRRHGHGPAVPEQAKSAGGREAPSRKAARARPGPHAARSPLARLAPVAVALVTAIAYANAPGNVIVHDDRFFYPSHGPLDAASIVGFFRRDVWGAATGVPGLYRPFLLLSLAIDTDLFGGSALAAHRMNVAFHVGATLALYAFVLALLRSVQLRASIPADVVPLAAAAAAAAFGVHPIHTEAVDSIFNRSEVLATICTLLALGVVWRWEEQRRVAAWSAAAVLYLTGLFFRESAVALPALAVLLIALMRPEGGLDVRRFAPAALLLLPLVVYLPLRRAALAAAPISSLPQLTEAVPPTGALGLLAFTLGSLSEYVRMVAWPYPLRVSYEDFAGGNVLLAVLVNATLVGLAVFARRRMPALSFGIGFFYLVLAPSTRLLTAPGLELSLGGHVFFHSDAAVTPLAERIVYLPSTGLAVSLAFGLAALGRRYGPPAVLALGLALVLLLAPLTLARNLAWHGGLSLAEAEVRGGPQNGDAWRMYAGVLFDEGRHAEIVDICDEHAGVHPRSAQLQNTCGSAYGQVDRLDDAVAAYRRAIDAGLATTGHANLGRVYARMGRTAEAEQEFQLAADAEQDPAAHHYRLGLLIERFHPERLADAAAEYRRALQLRPGYATAQEALRRVGGR